MSAENEFEIIHEEDYTLRQISDTQKKSSVSIIDFSIAGTYLQLNYQKHQSSSISICLSGTYIRLCMNHQREPVTNENFIIRVEVDSPQIINDKKHYRFRIITDQKPEIGISKRFSEFYDFMESLKNHFATVPLVANEYCAGFGQSQDAATDIRKYLGYHVVPNLYKPDVVSNVVNLGYNANESYRSDEEKKRIFFLRNFLLKILTHSHLAECQLTREFLQHKKSDDEPSNAASLVKRSKQMVGKVYETLLDKKNAYFEKKREPSECCKRKAEVELLCKFIRDYNEKLGQLYKLSIQSRADSHPEQSRKVLEDLLEDMKSLLLYTEDIWVTLETTRHTSNK